MIDFHLHFLRQWSIACNLINSHSFKGTDFDWCLDRITSVIRRNILRQSNPHDNAILAPFKISTLDLDSSTEVEYCVV